MNIEEFPSLSAHNREELTKHDESGCYFCTTVFPSGTVTEFTDKGQTALCPHCNIDAVLPGVTDKNVLAQGLERWFTRTNTGGG